MLQQLNLTIEQAQVLDLLLLWQGVLRFGFFAKLDETPIEIADHKMAVRLALLNLQTEWETYADRTSVSHNIERSKFSSIKIDEMSASTLVLVKIDSRQFLGTRYDFQRQGLLTRGKQTFLNNLFFFDDVESQDNIVPFSDIEDGCGNGLAYAFSDTPYGLSYHDGKEVIQPTRKEIGVLFKELLEKVICMPKVTEIYQWPTNWCSYFDAGNEWWGSFLWSISSHDDKKIVVIAASTTD